MRRVWKFAWPTPPRSICAAWLNVARWQAFHPDGSPYAPSDLPLSQVVKFGRVIKNLEMLIRRSNGEEKWILANAAPVRNADGEIIAGVAVFMNITKLKRAEQERRRLAAATEQAAEGVMLTDIKGRIQYVNPAFEAMTGYKRLEVFGKNPCFLKSGKQDDAFYKNLWETITNGNVWTGRFINKKKDGSLIQEDATISPIRDDTRTIIGFAAIKRDVTDEVQREAQQRQAQKMEAIGALAGGIAHDFNNILQAISGFADLAMDDIPIEHPVRNALEQISGAASRATELVAQILTFSRQKEQERKPMRVQSVVKEAVALLRGSLPSTIEIIAEVQKDCPPVLADATQVHQVIMNLCTNAYHAMRDTGGVLKVQLRSMKFEEEDIAGHIDLHTGPYVELTVSDTGHGMDRMTMDRIFEPFFTTKRMGEGTGMGLATVHGIVTSHGGAIRVYSELGHGAVFRVYIPAHLVETAEALSVTDNPLPRGTERVLVVDDESSVAILLRRMLEGLGYAVQVFNDSQQALELFRESPGLFDIVVTDLTMPRLTGLRLAEAIHETRPEMPIVLCSGFADSVNPETNDLKDIAVFLQKPLQRRDLALAVRKAFETWRSPTPREEPKAPDSVGETA
jgi:PAS domain S-box-containing protein